MSRVEKNMLTMMRARASTLLAAWAISWLASGCAQQATWHGTDLAWNQPSPAEPGLAAPPAPVRIESDGPMLSPGISNTANLSSANTDEVPADPVGPRDPPATAKPPASMPEVIRATPVVGAVAGSAEVIPPPPPARDDPSAPGAGAPSAPLVERIAGTDRISLHFDEVDVRKALEIISRQAKLNLLVSPAVSGQVTVDLRDVSIEEALDAIFKACRLAAVREKGILYVYTVVEQRLAGDQDPVVRTYRLKYVKSGDVMKMIKPLLSKQGVVAASPQSEVGIKADPEKGGGDSLAGGEAMIVQDSQRVLERIDRVVAELDVQPVQVLIEAVILQVTLESDRTLGVNYGVLDRVQGGILSQVGNGSVLNSAAGFTPAAVITAAGKVADGNQSGFAEDTQGLKFGFVTKNLTGFIKALQSYGDTKVLAAPRLLVVNKQRADLQLGNRLAYYTITQTQTSTVQQVNFMNVGTQLHLRPFVADGGIVRMEVHPEESDGLLVDGLPQTNSAEVTTNVMIPDGVTVVIGGLMTKKDDVEQQGVPWLCDLPWIGPLFRQRITTHKNVELVVILTPHIWQPKSPGTLPSSEQPVGALPPPIALSDPCAHVESHAELPGGLQVSPMR